MTGFPRSLRSRWSDGETTIGAWLTYREPLLAEIAALSGYDYVCIDLQHGLMDLDTASHMMTATVRTETVPMARVPWNEPGIIGRVLDAGALAVVIPMVNTADEARRAVESCRYAPVGSRSFGPSLPNNRYGSTYPVRANDEVAVIPMIETREALANLDEIVSVPGVDAVYIGPADLSIALGLPPGMDHEAAIFNDALEAVVAACHRHGVVPGVHANSSIAAKRYAQGFRMITVGYEIFAAQTALRGDGKAARAAIAEAT
jgi:4-hydroxy-2-oxoheptanedioate aldolase